MPCLSRDLENLAASQIDANRMVDDASNLQPEDSNIAYDYFLCVKKNDLIYDIDGADELDSYRLVSAREKLQLENDSSDYENAHDSEDSNRESAEANDYPDERSD